MMWQQFLIAFLCNVATLTFGLQAGWLSPLQPAFQSEHSPLGGPPMTDEEISWIGSLPSIMSIVATPLFGWTMDKYGRKFTLLLTTLPNLVGYLLLICANNVSFVYAARIIGGFCSTGAFVTGPIYISETVTPKWRGTLGSLTGFAVKFGIIFSYVMGSYTSYLTLNLLSCSFTVVFLLCTIWLPESPVFLIKQGKWLEAEAALVKLWGVADKGKINEEIELIRVEMCEQAPQRKSLAILKQFIISKPLRRAQIIVCGLFACQTFGGYPAVVRYTVDIFEKSGITYSPHMAAILLGVAQLVSSFLGAVLVDKTGRKKLVLFSLMSMTAFMGVLAVYLVLQSDNAAFVGVLRFAPTAALVGYIVSYAAGFGTVPFVIIPELFSSETRATASTISNMWYSMCEFVVLKLFPTLTNEIHLWGSLAIFSVFGAVGCVFLSVFMFETRGLDIESVQRILRKEGKSEESTEPIDDVVSEKMFPSKNKE